MVSFEMTALVAVSVPVSLPVPVTVSVTEAAQASFSYASPPADWHVWPQVAPAPIYEPQSDPRGFLVDQVLKEQALKEQALKKQVAACAEAWSCLTAWA